MRTVYGASEHSVIDLDPIVQVKRLYGQTKTAQTGTVSLGSFTFEPRKVRGTDTDYFYASVRMISARVNQNFDAFSAEELERSYRTFIGRPVFINHANSDIRRMRGLVRDAAIHTEDPRDVWVEGLHEIDSVTYPRLCAAIASRELDTTSMGTNISHSTCSVCGHSARFPSEFCQHIRHKGSVFEKNGMSVLAYEECWGNNFFEDSFVFSPADSSATIKALMMEGI